MAYFGKFYLDREKDMVVTLDMADGEMSYVLRTPNHGTGNLITNFAGLCGLPISFDETGLKIIRGTIPCYLDARGREVWIFRLGNTKVANIYPDGTVELKASVPAISKTLMSQTKDYGIDFAKTIVKTYILKECKFRTDLHTHMNANLAPDVLIALGLCHHIPLPVLLHPQAEAAADGRAGAGTQGAPRGGRRADQGGDGRDKPTHRQVPHPPH